MGSTGVISKVNEPEVPHVQLYQTEFVSASENHEPVIQEFASPSGSLGSAPPPFRVATPIVLLAHKNVDPEQSAPGAAEGV